ncbi:hypothetical protein WICMUC_005281 [Wickerhamomyces mucosus]|uniref:Uncharacterized protein n=1 Tax=Wickerhamomyces mucosus TaxID=1378264 RepID=A0A9P8PA71_9ASCO|nr:hypothetical protein WICMUC_005281 [Wickerhamomyces mucosus]
MTSESIINISSNQPLQTETESIVHTGSAEVLDPSTDIEDEDVVDLTSSSEVKDNEHEEQRTIKPEVDDTDEQIESLLKEVEEIKKLSPIKAKEEPVIETSVTSTVSPPQFSTITQNAEKKPIADIKSSNIPKSVSQALFSSGLKVTKVRDKSSAPKFIGHKAPENPQANAKIEELQNRDYSLSLKIAKLTREINYLKNLIETASISSDLSELRKLKFAIERLEEFLDVKQKEKYEIGISLTRAVRRRVDSGEVGEYWVN